MELSDEEREYLLELLKTAHAALLHELHHAHRRTFEKMLKERVALNEQLTEKIEIGALELQAMG